MGSIIMDGVVIGTGSLIAGALVSPGTIIPPNSCGWTLGKLYVLPHQRNKMKLLKEYNTI